MTRKHYIQLAASLAACRPTDPTALITWRACREAIMSALHTDNPSFDRQRFITATEV